jgi:hypothetical protein
MALTVVNEMFSTVPSWRRLGPSPVLQPSRGGPNFSSSDGRCSRAPQRSRRIVRIDDAEPMRLVLFLPRRRSTMKSEPLAGGLFAATPAPADLILDFDNSRPDASSLSAYVTFAGGGAFDATAVMDGVTQQLQLGQSYSLSDLSGGVDVTQYDSGRAFVSLGAPLTGLSASNNYPPNFVAPQQNPNLLTRFDKYEINYVTKNDVTSC